MTLETLTTISKVVILLYCRSYKSIHSLLFLLFGIVLFFGLLLIYPFNVISISAMIYLTLLPISFLHYQKLKKENEDVSQVDDEDQEDIL